MGSFGEKFREERERRGFTLDDVSNVTKINSRMLQAIEQEHFDVLPGGVFNKGFVRAYAKLLGFNDQEAVAGYLTALRQAQLDAHNAAWDQPLPPHTTFAPVTSAPATAQVAENSRIAEPAASSSSSKWSPPQPLVSVANSASAAPKSSSPESPAPRPNETSERESQVPPIVVAPPLWISPPLSSSSPAKSLPSPPPLVSAPPVTPAPVPLASVPVSLSSEMTRHSESASDDARFRPQILAEKPAGQQKGERPMLVAVPAQRSSSAQWKTPLAILGLGVIVVAALLWGRHSRPVSPTLTASTTANASPSAMPGNPSPPPDSSSATNTIAKPGGNETTEHTASSAGLTTHSAAHSPAKKPLAPVPFRVAIRASENCWISVTADGELIARENLIAPATTSMKANREMVVQVSNPAGVIFRWNDRTISAQSGDSGTKTFVFDNTGLRTTP